MSYKKMDNNFSFTDLSLADSMEHNRSISRMDKINAIINWWGQRDAVNLLTSCQYERVVFGNLLGMETAALLI